MKPSAFIRPCRAHVGLPHRSQLVGLHSTIVSTIRRHARSQCFAISFTRRAGADAEPACDPPGRPSRDLARVRDVLVEPILLHVGRRQSERMASAAEDAAPRVLPKPSQSPVLFLAKNI